MKITDYLTREVLDHGKVMLLNGCGNDSSIAEYAGICTGKFALLDQHIDQALVERRIDRLMSQGHTTPFEFATLVFYVKAPIFVARQWMRHRTFSYLERSGRYTEPTGDIYDPTGELQDYNQAALDKYKQLLETGSVVKKEQARVVLPLGMYTEFLFKADLHNLFHFLELRLAPTAQKEMREYANAVFSLTKIRHPVSCNAFTKYVLKSDVPPGSTQEAASDCTE